MLDLASQVRTSRADGADSPDDLIQWGSEREGLKLGLLIAGTVAPGNKLSSRLVIRNVLEGNSDRTLTLKGCSLKLLTRDNERRLLEWQPSFLLVYELEVPVTLRPGEQIEVQNRSIQFGVSMLPVGEKAYIANVNRGFTFVKFQLNQLNRPALETGEATVLVEPFAARSTVTELLAFTLQHKLARTMEVSLRQVLKGRPAQKAKASLDDKTLYVVAYLDVMKRVRTFILVNDATDTLDRGDTFDYPNYSPSAAARSFFHACATEDAEKAISNLLSVAVLAQLRGDNSSNYNALKKSSVTDPAYESELRGDWPEKRERIRELVRQWNRYALVGLQEPLPV
ncbi:MAG: hypothetical protein ABI557_03810, partial [Aureliella sp.]